MGQRLSMSFWSLHTTSRDSRLQWLPHSPIRDVLVLEIYSTFSGANKRDLNIPQSLKDCQSRTCHDKESVCQVNAWENICSSLARFAEVEKLWGCSCVSLHGQTMSPISPRSRAEKLQGNGIPLPLNELQSNTDSRVNKCPVWKDFYGENI